MTIKICRRASDCCQKVGDHLEFIHYQPVFRRLENLNVKEEEIMAKYRCVVCNYIYDPAIGDPDGGIAPGTAFEDIPDDWVCPLCGADKSNFEKA